MAQRSRPPRRTEADETRTDPESQRDGSPPICLPIDEAFSVLRNARRRTVITYLARNVEKGASVREITRMVAAAEHDIPAEHLTDRQQKCVYVSLLQVHLPALVEGSVVEWDESTGAVEGKESVEALAAMVDLVEWACGPDANGGALSQS